MPALKEHPSPEVAAVAKEDEQAWQQLQATKSDEAFARGQATEMADEARRQAADAFDSVTAQGDASIDVRLAQKLEATWAAQAKREDEAREREDRVLAEKMQEELNQSSEEQGRAAAKEK